MHDVTNAPIESSLLTWRRSDHRAWRAGYGRLVLEIEQVSSDGNRWRWSIRHPVYGEKRGYAPDAGKAMGRAVDEAAVSCWDLAETPEAVAR